MSFANQNRYSTTYNPGTFAAAAGVAERTTFIRRTYMHLAGAVFAFIALELVIFNMVPERTLLGVTEWMFGGMQWMLVLIAL